MDHIPVKELKGVGDKTAQYFKKLNIEYVDQLLGYYPRTYISFPAPQPIDTYKPGELATVSAFVTKVNQPVKKGRFTIVRLIATEGSNTIELTFFNQPYIAKVIKNGTRYIFRGKLHPVGAKYELDNPVFYSLDDYRTKMKQLMPIYPLTAGLKNSSVCRAMKAAIEFVPSVPEVYPPLLVDELEIKPLNQSLRMIHCPTNESDVACGRRRLAFDEFFIFLTLLRNQKEFVKRSANENVMIETADTKRLIEALPFRLTVGQKKAWKEISEDLSGPTVMNRLIQGDVGSGKTILAILALLMCAANGYQGAMMAPTEVLAVQHMESVVSLIKKYNLPLKPVLLVGSLTAAQKKEVQREIAEGEVNLIIGTQALIQEKVSYKRLALVVTDEQHRFGVRQREILSQKGNMPHILVMSATPIPRTLAIVLYGDLSVSNIKDKPSQRLAIKNCVVGQKFRPKAHEFMASEVAKGHQCYVICPMVENDEEEEGAFAALENVVDYTEKLKTSLPPSVRVGYLHGKMKPADKNRIMQDFADRNIDILVSTTVIEVGINVPNATVMLVENAERFGLASLHQLRGRVGRGSDQSYCIFLTSKEDEKTMERLSILNNSNDGFEIAQEDLRLRGPGELFGEMQSGELAFKIADIYADADLLSSAKEWVDRILDSDPSLTLPVHASLAKYISERSGEFVDFRTI